MQGRTDDARLQTWCEWLREAWSTAKGARYRWLNYVSFAPLVTFLTRPDRTATVNELDGSQHGGGEVAVRKGRMQLRTMVGNCWKTAIP